MVIIYKKKVLENLRNETKHPESYWKVLSFELQIGTLDIRIKLQCIVIPSSLNGSPSQVHGTVHSQPSRKLAAIEGYGQRCKGSEHTLARSIGPLYL
uniref:Uncharacterized protein n=1 Tax=Anguilla anguilla TaxID=7936 RepID=A0A0E9WLE6_ANGAN